MLLLLLLLLLLLGRLAPVVQEDRGLRRVFDAVFNGDILPVT